MFTVLQAAPQIRSAKQNRIYDFLVDGAAKAGLSLAYVLAVASRETGIRNIAGDGGHGKGILQVDDRYHSIAREKDFVFHPAEFIEYGCNLLRSNLNQAQKRWPGLTHDQHLRIAAAAYNCGMGNVIKAVRDGNCDKYTAHGDYGKDVMLRKSVFEKLISSSKKARI